MGDSEVTFSPGRNWYELSGRRVACGGELDQALLVDDNVLALIRESSSNRLTLEVYSRDGGRKHRIEPPVGFDFYYLTRHHLGPAVVCTTEKSIGGWSDWHFLVGVEDGRLTRASPSK